MRTFTRLLAPLCLALAVAAAAPALGAAPQRSGQRANPPAGRTSGPVAPVGDCTIARLAPAKAQQTGGPTPAGLDVTDTWSAVRATCGGKPVTGTLTIVVSCDHGECCDAHLCDQRPDPGAPPSAPFHAAIAATWTTGGKPRDLGKGTLTGTLSCRNSKCQLDGSVATTSSLHLSISHATATLVRSKAEQSWIDYFEDFLLSEITMPACDAAGKNC